MGYDMQWEKDDSDDGYHRANISGMGFLRWAMDEAGVLDWDAEQPPWPEDNEDEAAHEEAVKPVLSFRSKDPGKVPGEKFCSNDGWYVVPEESRTISTGMSAWLNLPGAREVLVDHLDPGETIDDLIQYLTRWIAYCQKCADAETAFRVF